MLIRFMLMIMGLFAGNFFRDTPHLRRSRGSRQEVWTQDVGVRLFDLQIENYLTGSEQKNGGNDIWGN